MMVYFEKVVLELYCQNEHETLIVTNLGLKNEASVPMLKGFAFQSLLLLSIFIFRLMYLKETI